MPTFMPACTSALAWLPSYLPPCLHACVHACLPTCLRACLSACQPTCLPACLLASLPACTLACSLACMLAWLATCLHASLHSSLHAYLHSCMHSFLHACLCSCRHACLHILCLYACLMYVQHAPSYPAEACFFLPACPAYQTCPGCLSFLYFLFPWLLVVLWRPSTSRGQILNPWMGDIVDSDIGLSHWPASIQYVAWRAGTTMPESTISLQSGTKNLATVQNQLGLNTTWKHYILQ